MPPEKDALPKEVWGVLRSTSCAPTELDWMTTDGFGDERFIVGYKSRDIAVRDINSLEEWSNDVAPRKFVLIGGADFLERHAGELRERIKELEEENRLLKSLITNDHEDTVWAEEAGRQVSVHPDTKKPWHLRIVFTDTSDGEIASATIANYRVGRLIGPMLKIVKKYKSDCDKIMAANPLSGEAASPGGAERGAP